MGTFQGHALPGTFMMVFAIWWTIQITRRKMVCSAKGIDFYNTITYPCFCLCVKFPTEGVVKILASLTGMILEGYAASKPIRDGHVGAENDFHGFYIGDIQHITMYTFFFFSGICDVMVNRKLKMIPEGIDYVASALAAAVEAILFRFHLHGRNELDKVLHTLLLYVLVLCVVCILMEYKYPFNLYVGMARIYFVFLQGTWFYQVGFILYPPLPGLEHWDGDSHESIMLASIVFAWHIAGVFLAMITISGVTYCISRKYCDIWNGSKEYRWTQLPNSVDNESADDIELTKNEFDV